MELFWIVLKPLGLVKAAFSWVWFIIATIFWLIKTVLIFLTSFRIIYIPIHYIFTVMVYAAIYFPLAFLFNYITIGSVKIIDSKNEMYCTSHYEMLYGFKQLTQKREEKRHDWIDKKLILVKQSNPGSLSQFEGLEARTEKDYQILNDKEKIDKFLKSNFRNVIIGFNTFVSSIIISFLISYFKYSFRLDVLKLSLPNTFVGVVNAWVADTVLGDWNVYKGRSIDHRVLGLIILSIWIIQVTDLFAWFMVGVVERWRERDHLWICGRVETVYKVWETGFLLRCW